MNSSQGDGYGEGEWKIEVGIKMVLEEKMVMRGERDMNIDTDN